MLFPFPDAPDECFASQVMPILAFRLQLALDDDLGRDPGMVGSHHPVRVVAAHAVIADERVHERLLEGMPHVQRAGDVRRGQLYAIGRLALVEAGLEVAVLFPEGIPARFDRCGLETFGELHIGKGRCGKSGHYIRAARDRRVCFRIGLQCEAQILQLGMQRLFYGGAHHRADVVLDILGHRLQRGVECGGDLRDEALLHDRSDMLVEVTLQLLIDAMLEVLHLDSRDHFTGRGL